MPSPQPPKEAVEALAKRIARGRRGGRWRNDWDLADVRAACRAIARRDLAAIEPLICKQECQRVREALLSEESLETMRLDLVGSGWDEASAICGAEREGLRDDLDAAVAAALETLEDPDPPNGRGAGERGSPPEASELSADNLQRERDEAIQARREIESKLASGYSLCHPEEDCEGQRALLKVAAERDQLLEEADRHLRHGVSNLADLVQAARHPGGGERP